MKKLLKSLPIILILCLFQSNLYSQIDNVHISHERISNRLLAVWGGKIYKDQVVTIATEKGLVLIDTGKSPTLTKKYRRIIEEEFDRNDFSYVINTHYHFDHTSGNQVFPEAKIIAHDKTPGLMTKWADEIDNFVNTRRSNQMIRWNNQIQGAEPGSVEWIRFNDYLTTGKVMLDDYENNYVLTLPDITFNGRMTGEYIALYHKYMKDVYETLSIANDRGMKFDEVLAGYSYEKRFPYIEKSGLDKGTLQKGHAGNLKNTWEHINSKITDTK